MPSMKLLLSLAVATFSLSTSALASEVSGAVSPVMVERDATDLFSHHSLDKRAPRDNMGARCHLNSMCHTSVWFARPSCGLNYRCGFKCVGGTVREGNRCVWRPKNFCRLRVALSIKIELTCFSAYGAPYSAAAAVLLNELLKGSLSLGVAVYNSYKSTPYGSGYFALPSSDGSDFDEKRMKEERDLESPPERDSPSWSGSSKAEFYRDSRARARQFAREIFSPDCWKLSIPAILYVIQNNLQYVAAANLDVATFQVTYQMKILSTALFSVLMLKRSLSTLKWLSLLGLAIGVGIVQIQAGQVSGGAAATTHEMHPMTGFLAVAAACITSGIAGVYFEMVLKGSKSDLWIRNVQLAGWSILPALIPAFFPDLSFASLNPFGGVNQAQALSFADLAIQARTRAFDVNSSSWIFAGFGMWAWSTVLCQCFGGLITAVVIKYSDNILKGFATSLSIVLSFMAGIVLFNFRITPSFVIGCSVVLASTYVYNKPAPESKPAVSGKDLNLAIELPLSSSSSSSSLSSASPSHRRTTSAFQHDDQTYSPSNYASRRNSSTPKIQIAFDSPPSPFESPLSARI